MKIRDRIRELRRVPASELKPNPKNWRTHPKSQQDALRGVLAEVGMADACLARELPDGTLMLIDGHMRAETIVDTDVPVLILDVNEDEADKILATLDPLSAMAESDAEKLEELLSSVTTSNKALEEMLESTSIQAGLFSTLGGVAASQAGLSDEDQDEDEVDSPYTTKVNVPPYEVTGPKPSLSQLCDDSKCRKLIKDIDESDLPEDEKEFLRTSAYRHAVFNFQEVANYYANSDAKAQQLMEDSALVIVDLDRAIQNGWTRLSKRLDEVFSEEKEQEVEA